MSEKKCFGIIGAMDVEIDELVKAFDTCEEVRITNLIFYVGTMKGQNVIVVKCGIGKVNAARCTQLLYDAFHPDYIINSGIAGGITDGIRIGDLVIGTELVQFDFDVSALGHSRGYLYLGEDNGPTVFHSDPMLVETAVKAAKQLGIFDQTRTGRIATGDQFTAENDLSRMVNREMGADAKEMEGCAIAQVCDACDVPFLVMRFISDVASGNPVEDYPSFEKEVGETSAHFAEAFIGCLA